MQFAIMQFVTEKLTDELFIKKLIDENNLNLIAKPFVPVLPPAMANTATYEATIRERMNEWKRAYYQANKDRWKKGGRYNP